jgi:hypothetical protein
MKDSSSPDLLEHHVVIIQDRDQRRVLALDAAAYSIGRDPANAIVLDCDAVSRQHAMLIRLPIPGTQHYHYRLLDGNSQGKPSANGLFVNGERCTMRQLVSGDIICFGRNLEATYLTVAMNEAEFSNYLESLAFHSLKSDVTDAKATIMAAEFLELDTPVLTVMDAPTSRLQSPPAIPEPSLAPAKETIRLQRPKKTNPRPLYRLWMLFAAGLGVLVVAGASLWLAVRPQPRSVDAQEAIQPPAD